MDSPLKYERQALPDRAVMLTRNFPHKEVKASNPAFRRGQNYQSFVTNRLDREWGLQHASGLWFNYWIGDRIHAVQVDSLVFNLSAGIIYLIECKYTHTFVAYQQLMNRYRPVLLAAFRPRAFPRAASLACDRAREGLTSLRSDSQPLLGGSSHERSELVHKTGAHKTGDQPLFKIICIEACNFYDPNEDHKIERAGGRLRRIEDVEEAQEGYMNVMVWRCATFGGIGTHHATKSNPDFARRMMEAKRAIAS